MACRCKRYIDYTMRMQFLRTVEVVVDGGEVVLIVPPTVFENYENVILCIAQPIPFSTADEAVYVQAGYETGSSEIARLQIRDTAGNTVNSYQLRSHKLYRLIASSNEGGFIISPRCLEQSGDILTRTAPVTPPANQENTPAVQSMDIKKGGK